MSLDETPTSTSSVFQRASETALYLRSALPDELRNPRVAVVCGSGLGGLAETLNEEPRIETAYENIPNIPISTVQSHAGKLVFGLIGSHKMPVVMLVGRAHFYEGYTMEIVTFATRVCKMLGIETMILTNAAGGLNPSYKVGDIVILNDHLNLAGLVGINPLRGPNVDDFGVRFPPLSDAYNLDLRRRAHKAWEALGQGGGARTVHEGVYAFVGGPSYETRAECRMLRNLGADLVGMSTVPELIVARHSGIRVLAMTLVTNNAVLEAGVSGGDPTIQGMSTVELEEYLQRGMANHQEVIEEGQRAAKNMQELVRKILIDLSTP